MRTRPRRVSRCSPALKRRPSNPLSKQPSRPPHSPCGERACPASGSEAAPKSGAEFSQENLSALTGAAWQPSAGKPASHNSRIQATRRFPDDWTPPLAAKKILKQQTLTNQHSGRNPTHFGRPLRPSAATQSRIFPYNARVNRACNIPLHRDEEPDLEPALEHVPVAPPLKPHAEHPLAYSV